MWWHIFDIYIYERLKKSEKQTFIPNKKETVLSLETNRAALWPLDPIYSFFLFFGAEGA